MNTINYLPYNNSFFKIRRNFKNIASINNINNEIRVNNPNKAENLGRTFAYETSNEFHADSIYTGCDDHGGGFMFSPVFRDEMENNQRVIYKNPANVNNPNMINCVNITLTGYRNNDYALANLACGRTQNANDKPDGYTWHHVFMGYYAQKFSIEGDFDQAGNPIEYLMYYGGDWNGIWTFDTQAYMQLVLSDVHVRCYPHRGSCWQFVQSYNSLFAGFGWTYAADFGGDYGNN